MSNGSGTIIIRHLIESPETTDTEKQRLEKIEQHMQSHHCCPPHEIQFVLDIVERLLR
jgi:hypothetical protein